MQMAINYTEKQQTMVEYGGPYASLGHDFESMNRHFLELGVDLIEEIKEVSSREISIADLGCGIGQGIEYLARNIEQYLDKEKKVKFYGIDTNPLPELLDEQKLISPQILDKQIDKQITNYFSSEYFEKLKKDSEITREKIEKAISRYQEEIASLEIFYSEQFKIIEGTDKEGVWFFEEEEKINEIHNKLVEKLKKNLYKEHKEYFEKRKKISQEIHDKILTTFISSDLTDMKLIPSNSIDIAYSDLVNRYVKDSLKFFEEVHRILRPGGKAFIWTHFGGREISIKPSFLKIMKRVNVNNEFSLLPVSEEIKNNFNYKKMPEVMVKITKYNEKTIKFPYKFSKSVQLCPNGNSLEKTFYTAEYVPIK